MTVPLMPGQMVAKIHLVRIKISEPWLQLLQGELILHQFVSLTFITCFDLNQARVEMLL